MLINRRSPMRFEKSLTLILSLCKKREAINHGSVG